MIDGPDIEWFFEQTLFGTACEVDRAYPIRSRREASRKTNLPVPHAAFWINTEGLRFDAFDKVYESEIKILFELSRGQAYSADQLAIVRLGPGVCGAEGAPSRYLRHRDFEFAKQCSIDLLAFKKVEYDSKKLTFDQWSSLHSLLRQVRPTAGFEVQALIKLAILADELNAEKGKNGFLRQILAVKN